MAPASHTTSPALRAAEVARPATALAEDHTLAGEHALLMRDVERRAAPVLTLIDVRVWPHAELGTLVKFLRVTVLRRVSDEETLLYPPDASAPPFAELSADHVHLHSLTARLERAYSEPCPPAQLRALADELLSTLRRHLTIEQQVLAALPDADTDIPHFDAERYGEGLSTAGPHPVPQIAFRPVDNPAGSCPG